MKLTFLQCSEQSLESLYVFGTPNALLNPSGLLRNQLHLPGSVQLQQPGSLSARSVLRNNRSRIVIIHNTNNRIRMIRITIRINRNNNRRHLNRIAPNSVHKHLRNRKRWMNQEAHEGLQWGKINNRYVESQKHVLVQLTKDIRWGNTVGAIPHLSFSKNQANVAIQSP